MTLEDLYTWLAPQMQNPDAVRMGSLDGQAEQFLALYEVSKDAGTPARICLGGPDCTHWDDMTVRLVLRWGKSQPEAEAEARRLWGLFYGRTSLLMGSTLVLFADPGAGPSSLGKGGDGVFEYELHVRLVFKK